MCSKERKKFFSSVGGLGSAYMNAHNVHQVNSSHIMVVQGFSSSLFALWRDQNGNPRTPRDPASKLPPVVNGCVHMFT